MTAVERVVLARVASAWAHVEQALAELEDDRRPAGVRARASVHHAAAELVELYRAAAAGARPPLEAHGSRRTGGVR